MAVNERVKITSDSIFYQQKVQTGRTAFTPGKTTSKPLDENWPKDFVTPTANSAFNSGSNKLESDRVFLLGRNTVADDTIPAPQSSGTDHRSETSPGGGYSGSYDIELTNTQDNNGTQERRSSFDKLVNS